mmetsp:Transcript_2684/g.4053  ORF Transcript_2684/g.4053 Transcript_2684/m.4053 type:complete len:467 (-) Transcript_2684:132-1532(-)
MIKYTSGAYGIQALLRFHGSAAYKALLPSLFSVLVYVVLDMVTALNYDPDMVQHPYALGALIVAFTFLLSFKATFSYNRYWEAVTAVHQMHSKWLDVGMNLVSFHLQSDIYKKKPPAFGQHPELNVYRDGKRNYRSSKEVEDKLDQGRRETILKAFVPKGIIRNTDENEEGERNGSVEEEKTCTNLQNVYLPTADNPIDLKTKTPSPFLQEAAHLLSLLSAVAMSTLRNDVEAAESPLATFYRGDPWPAVDPDSRDAQIRDKWSTDWHCWVVFRYLLGMARTDRDRTLYNAARPFRVIGGVSDSEIKLLQAARGAFAKVALVSLWLQEFISREYLNGSTGKVGPPIISRLFQFTSDGMLGYNQARKVAFIPFPFPHAQITALFVLVMLFIVPILVLTFVTNVYFGAVLNFFIIMCFFGLHEVSRELENPFQSVPNDIPLNNFQAQFNEALMNMFAGYHPDSWDWTT